MKKIDKLVLGAFLGPFLMTFLVVVFILLTQHMLKYFDDIIGKGLDADVIGQLLFYFAIFMTPVALPLAVLLSSLIAFGNLGEHFELTAIKSSGVSLVRTLRPIFFFVILLTGIAFYANNNLVPKAALEAYSLLYDIKQKKPALDLREGAFYSGINDMSIKVNKKYPDGKSLKDVVVYDHRKNDGNKEVTVADSGRMYTILDERYLKIELFNGYNYTEGANNQANLGGKDKGNAQSLSRSKFAKSQVVFDLSSFQLERTDKKWFEGNRIMRNLYELNGDIDSIKTEISGQRLTHYELKRTYFGFYNQSDSVIMPEEIYKYKVRRDSINRIPYLSKSKESQPSSPEKKIEAPSSTLKSPAASKPAKARSKIAINKTQAEKKELKEKRLEAKRLKQSQTSKKIKNKVITGVDSTVAKNTFEENEKTIDSIYQASPDKDIITNAANSARQVKSQLANSNTSIENYNKELAIFQIQWHKILASSMACIAMFLIGAPLGAIIKKGGLGMPFLVSILFFIVYYVLTMQGEKLAKQGTVSVAFGVWMADLILLIVGLFFLRQARADARLFEADFYNVVFDKVRRWFIARRPAHTRAI